MLRSNVVCAPPVALGRRQSILSIGVRTHSLAAELGASTGIIPDSLASVGGAALALGTALIAARNSRTLDSLPPSGNAAPKHEQINVAESGCRSRVVEAAGIQDGEAVATDSHPGPLLLTSVHIHLVRSLADFGSLQQLSQIASLLGEAFYRDYAQEAAYDSEVVEDGVPARMQAAVRTALGLAYGWQLTLQMLWMHVCYPDSTISLVATAPCLLPCSSEGLPSSLTSAEAALPGTGHAGIAHAPSAAQVQAARPATTAPAASRVIGTAVVQLKVTGKELHDAVSVVMGLPVLIVSNVAVASGWRRRGVARAIMAAAQDAAVSGFALPESMAVDAAALVGSWGGDSNSSVSDSGLDGRAVPADAGSGALCANVARVMLTSRHGPLSPDAARHPLTEAVPECQHPAASTDLQPPQFAPGDSTRALGGAQVIGRKGGWAWWQRQPAVFLALIVYKDNAGAMRCVGCCGRGKGGCCM
jgi:hypothetical protein